MPETGETTEGVRMDETEIQEEKPVEAETAKQDETDWKAEAEKWKALSRKWEDRAKSAPKADDERIADLEGRLEAIEREKSELQRSIDHARDIEAIAEEYGIDKAVLRGDTIDEIRKHAEQLKPLMAPQRAAVRGGNEVRAVSATREGILAIKNEKERLQAIRDNIELFDN